MGMMSEVSSSNENRRGVFKTGNLTPEEVIQFMDDTPSDHDVPDSDDDLIYSDDDFAVDSRLGEISPEDDFAIEEHLAAAGKYTMMLTNTINMLLDLSLGDLRSTYRRHLPQCSNFYQCLTKKRSKQLNHSHQHRLLWTFDQPKDCDCHHCHPWR